MRKTARKSGNRACISLAVIIPIIAVLACGWSVLYDRGFYSAQFEKNSVNMTLASETAEFLFGYFSSESAEEPDSALFSEKEKSHLLDVKKVIDGGFYLLYALAGSAAVLAYLNRRKCAWGRTLLCSGIALIAVPALLYMLPFGFLFNLFHSLLFEPGTWMLPANSALITVFPESFFYSAAIAVFLRVFVTGWLLIIFGFLVGKIRH